MAEKVNPHEFGTQAYWAFEAEKHAQPIQWPTNFGEWMAGMAFVGGLFGIFPALGRNQGSILAFVVTEVSWMLMGMVPVVAVYALISGPVYLFRATKWAMRKNIIFRYTLIGFAIGGILGIALAASMHDELIRGLVRLGVMGASVGLVVGCLRRLLRRA